MRLFFVRAAALLGFASTLALGAKQEPQRSCTAKSSNTGSFFDLSPISIPAPGQSSRKDARKESWQANGYDYGSNFTLNFCAPVVEELDEVVGVDKGDRKNVAAYYEANGRIYSIGLVNSHGIRRRWKVGFIAVLSNSTLALGGLRKDR